MKRILFFILISFLFYSCDQPGSTRIVEHKQDSIFLYTRLMAFKATHHNWSQNEVKRAEINSIFTDSINSWKSQGDFLKGIVFQLESVGEYKDNGQTVYGATFRKSSFDGDSVTMDIMGIVNKSDVDKLINNKHYALRGDVVKTLDRQPGLIADYYDLGAYRVKITEFKQAD